MADRYTYLPHIGLYIMLAWTAEELTANLPLRRWFWTAALVLLIPVLIQSHRGPDADLERQRDPLDQCPEGQSRNRLGREQSGVHCSIQRPDRTRPSSVTSTPSRSVRDTSRPASISATCTCSRPSGSDRGHAEVQELTDEALKHYRTAIEIRPDFELSYVNLGTGLMLRGEIRRGRGQLSHGPGE